MKVVHTEHTKAYHELVRHILDNGTWKQNRTGVRTLFVPAYTLTFDLRAGFPLLTTKKMAYRSIIAELIGFLRGYDSAELFRDLGCNVWNANANDPGKPEAPNRWVQSTHRKGEDDLGRIYGVQWRSWAGANGETYDQVRDLVAQLKKDPLDRRMIVSAWNVEDIKEGRMALPPCHVLHQALYEPETNDLHLCMFQRSAA